MGEFLGHYELLLWPSAALCALVSLGLYRGALAKVEERGASSWPLQSVIAVTRDLPEGAVITQDLVAIRAVPTAQVTSSVVPPDSVPFVLGQRVVVPLQAGDNLLWSQLELTHANERLSPRITRNLRAYTIAVNERKSVGGWVHPGDQADLVLSFSHSPQNQGRAAITLMQDIHVLAIGETTTTTVGQLRRKSVAVSVLLQPEEAEIASLAAQVGVLTMSLRGETNDHERVERNGAVTIQTLLDQERSQEIGRKRAGILKLLRR